MAQSDTPDTPPPLEAYGALPLMSDAVLSPDGEKLAVLATKQGNHVVLLFNKDMSFIRSMSVGTIKVRYIKWVGNDRIMLVAGHTQELDGFTTDKAEFSIALIAPIFGNGQVQRVFADEAKLVSSIFGSYGTRQIDGEWNLFFGALELQNQNGRWVFDHGRPHLYRYEVGSRTSKRVASAGRSGTNRDWLIDAQGEVAATFEISRNDGDWTIENADGERLAKGRQEAGRVGLVGLGYDGTSVIYAEYDDEGKMNLFEVSLEGGGAQPFLPGVDVDRVHFDPATGNLTGYVDESGEPFFEDAEMQNAVSSLKNSFDDLHYRVLDWAPDFSMAVVQASGSANSGTYYLVDLETNQVRDIGTERPAIAPDKVGSVTTFEYVAADGLELDGILTLPPGIEAKNLPVIMLPHGGPSSHDKEEFDWWAQAFASRGYAVFQPNFRGSTNRDDAFRRAGYGQWGRAMQTDISDGLSALAEAGIVDPQRACIVGASYGGYAALAGVTLQQGIYKCAVAVAPVSDIGDLYSQEYRGSGRRRVTRTGLLDQLGPKDGWKAVSPLRSAEMADAPIMLIHGEDDTVVPFSHSEKMADKLKDHRKPYELVTLEGEDHWLSLSSTRQQMLEASLAFVQEHNPAN
ncbi:alpha/beta hydrolase family protein [Paraurantiacibacter namhicola]|nr:alpha/beta fold hydrolase [Paraurantiacibacter namhicola]